MAGVTGCPKNPSTFFGGFSYVYTAMDKLPGWKSNFLIFPDLVIVLYKTQVFRLCRWYVGMPRPHLQYRVDDPACSLQYKVSATHNRYPSTPPSLLWWVGLVWKELRGRENRIYHHFSVNKTNRKLFLLSNRFLIFSLSLIFKSDDVTRSPFLTKNTGVNRGHVNGYGFHHWHSWNLYLKDNYVLWAECENQ